MLKKTGRTWEGQNIYTLCDNTAVTEDGNILKIHNDTFCETVYATNVIVNDQTAKDEVKNHIYFIEAVRVGEHIVNIIENKIDEENYIYVDFEELDDDEEDELLEVLSKKEQELINSFDTVEFVKFKDNSFIIDEYDDVYYNVVNEDTLDALEVIEDALNLNITKYEEFKSLNLDLEVM
ncbi:MAG: hypothetical protein U9N30_08975 [Campylobacterota bacterium]|nr:hypothetical protein [Campylobacterota bacterium]